MVRAVSVGSVEWVWLVLLVDCVDVDWTVHRDRIVIRSHREVGQSSPGRSVRAELSERVVRRTRSIRTVGFVPNSLASLWAEPAISNPPERSRRDDALAAAVAAGTVIEVVFRSDLVWPALGLVFGLAL